MSVLCTGRMAGRMSRDQQDSEQHGSYSYRRLNCADEYACVGCDVTIRTGVMLPLLLFLY